MNTEKYLKEAWFYNNQYDRSTIKELKPMAAQVIAEKEKLEKGQTTDEEPLTEAFNYFELRRRLLYDLKSKVISTWMDADRQRDHLVSRNPIPQNVRCQVCGSKMVFGTHVFK